MPARKLKQQEVEVGEQAAACPRTAWGFSSVPTKQAKGPDLAAVPPFPKAKKLT